MNGQKQRNRANFSQTDRESVPKYDCRCQSGPRGPSFALSNLFYYHYWSKMAEREGFEPSIRFWRILTFQASAFDHSATAPHALDEARALAAWWGFRKGAGSGMVGICCKHPIVSPAPPFP